MTKTIVEQFSLKNKIIIVTGGAGLLGEMHAEAILEAEGTPIILDMNQERIDEVVQRLKDKYKKELSGYTCDITKKEKIEEILNIVLKNYGRLDGLVNNAANNPKIGKDQNSKTLERFENMSLDFWNKDIEVGLTGTFLCCQVFGNYMASKKTGVILNFASDLAVIAPDQRLYRQEGLAEDSQPVKPVTYSVVKTGVLGLTRYLSTYWAENNVRVNSISPGGVFNGQDEVFLGRVSERIPLGRMANRDEYKSSVVYLLSEASSYMTGANLVIDGGRSVW